MTWPSWPMASYGQVTLQALAPTGPPARHDELWLPRVWRGAALPRAPDRPAPRDGCQTFCLWSHSCEPQDIITLAQAFRDVSRAQFAKLPSSHDNISRAKQIFRTPRIRQDSSRSAMAWPSGNLPRCQSLQVLRSSGGSTVAFGATGLPALPQLARRAAHRPQSWSP